MAAKLWWLIHKDLLLEARLRQAWPPMLLLGIVVVAVFSLQLQLPPEHRPAIVGGMLWLAVLLAGLLAIERTNAADLPEGCWDALRLFPVPPSLIFLAKLAVNFIALSALAGVLVLLFVLLASVPLLDHPGATLLVTLTASLCLATVGTLVGMLTSGLRHSSAILSMLALPLVTPVILAAGEATRLIAEDDIGVAWWRWVQLLGASSIVYLVVGVALFEFLLEE